MDDFSATQLCESSKSLSELSQTQTPEGDRKKQIGTLKIRNKEYPIYIGTNTLGRHNSNQIIIKDASVSKHHAEIEGRKRSCFVTDLKSLNGTFDQFKEKYLENKAYMLMNGSTVKFGQVEATFRHFRSEGNVIRTPVSARINQLVASTPQSALVNVVGNHSPRMSQLNIQVERPLKKRALRISDNEKHEETIIQVKNKRAKQDENSPDGIVISKTKLRSKENVNSSTEQVTTKKAEETIKVPANPKSRAISSKLEDSSSSMTEDSPTTTKNLKVPQNPRSRRTKRTNSPKNQIINSSGSMAEDSEDNSISKKSVPINSRSKRIKKNSPKIDVTNSSSSILEDSDSTLKDEKKNSKLPVKRTNSRRKANESSTNDSANISNQAKETIPNPRISRRGKIPTTSPSTSLIDETMKTDPNSSVASSSKTNLADTSTKELVKVNPRRGRAKKTRNEEEMNNTSMSSNLNETSSTTLEKTIITEPKKTRGRKTKTPNQSANQENLSASSTILSLPDSDLNSSTASTPTRAKRSRQSSPLKHKVLFTGIPVKDYQKQLTKLGLNETDDVNKCTILVTDKVRRTFKFLCAVSRGIPILSVKWITDSAKKSNIQDLENYVINDPTAESKFNFNLKESLQKARDRKMLEGYTVILTPNINAPPVAELKEMVTASGGKVVLRPPAKWLKDTIIVSNDQDKENANKFMAKAPKTVSLHSTEFLLTGILKQEVDLKSYLLKFT